MNQIDITQIGIGAVLGLLIQIFFIPFINRLYNDNKDLRKELSDTQDERYKDMKEVVMNTVEPIREFKESSKALMEFFGKLEDGKK